VDDENRIRASAIRLEESASTLYCGILALCRIPVYKGTSLFLMQTRPLCTSVLRRALYIAVNRGTSALLASIATCGGFDFHRPRPDRQQAERDFLEWRVTVNNREVLIRSSEPSATFIVRQKNLLADL
jgi:hypothetical protein